MRKYYLDDDVDSVIKNSLNKTIKDIHIIDDNLYINFMDGLALRVWDSQQMCCERRYMVCDDDLNEYKETQLISVNQKYTKSENKRDFIANEAVFLEFQTTNGTFTIVNHNEHNGYYGGFWIEAETTKAWIPKL